MLLAELLQRLEDEYDIVDLIDMLNISSNDLLCAFVDRVENNYPKLLESISDSASMQDVAFTEDTDNNN